MPSEDRWQFGVRPAFGPRVEPRCEPPLETATRPGLRIGGRRWRPSSFPGLLWQVSADARHRSPDRCRRLRTEDDDDEPFAVASSGARSTSSGWTRTTPTSVVTGQPLIGTMDFAGQGDIDVEKVQADPDEGHAPRLETARGPAVDRPGQGGRGEASHDRAAPVEHASGVWGCSGCSARSPIALAWDAPPEKQGSRQRRRHPGERDGHHDVTRNSSASPAR